MERGIEQGIEQGRREGRLGVLMRLLKRELGNLSTTVQSRVEGLSEQHLDQLTDRILNIRSTAA